MRRISVAQAKAHFSALISAVEQGEAVEITRRGVPVARVMRAPGSPAEDFDLEAFLASTTRQPMHACSDGAALVAELREGARY
jgi:prevent-host-death family protein